jgi:cyanophycinase-like exopeptidase
MVTLLKELGEIDAAVFGLGLGSILVDTLCAERTRMSRELKEKRLRHAQLLALGVDADSPEVVSVECDISWLEHRLG